VGVLALTSLSLVAAGEFYLRVLLKRGAVRLGESQALVPSGYTIGG